MRVVTDVKPGTVALALAGTVLVPFGCRDPMDTFVREALAREGEPEGALVPSVRSAVTMLAAAACPVRLVVLSAAWEPQQVFAAFSSALAELNSLRKLDLVVVSALPSPAPLRRAIASFTMEAQGFSGAFAHYQVSRSQLQLLMLRMACIHFSLSLAVVCDIPMKDAASEGMRDYDVTICFGASPHAVLGDVIHETSPGQFDVARQPDVERLCWNVDVQQKQTATHTPATCVHRVSALAMASSPTQCLMKHLLSGELVSLSRGNKDALVTHALVNHAGSIYLHCLAHLVHVPPVPPSEQPPPALRSHDLLRVMQNFVLQPRPGGSATFAAPVVAAELQRATGFFPLTTAASPLFPADPTPISRLLAPLLRTAGEVTIDSALLEASAKSIVSLREHEAQNAEAMFPRERDAQRRFAARYAAA